MFQISKYLQFRNTPDGKPRVLVEGEDYDLKSKNCLWLNGDDFSEGNNYIDSDFDEVSLADCRPLLTVEIDGVEWTELDFVKYTVGHWKLLGMIVFRNNHFGFYTVENIQEFTTFDTVKQSESKIEKLDMTLDKENYDDKIFKFLGIEK